MKYRNIALLLAGVSGLSIASAAEEFTAIPAITDVAVYRDGGATVTRRGTLKVPAGRHTLILDQLTESLDEEMLSLSFEDGEVRVYSQEISPSYSTTPASERQAAIEAQIAILRAQDKDLQAQERGHQMQLDFIRSLSQKQNTETSLSFTDWQNALAFVGQQSVDLLRKIEALTLKRTEIGQEIRKLERELRDTGPDREDFTSARFELMVPTEREVTYSLSYFVDDAGWSLATEGALNTTEKNLTIRAAAIVEQTTGEDWYNVRLSLSNNAPTDELGNIDQNPHILTLVEPNRMERKAYSMAPGPEMDVAMDAEEIVVTGSRVTANSSAFDRMYHIAGTVSLSSSGESEIIDLNETTSKAALVVRAIPERDTTAYLFSDTKLDNFPTLRNISPTLRRDGHFVGTGDWPDLVQGADLKLPYGPDYAVTVDYIEEAPEDGDSGFFGKNNAQEKRALIKITNSHTEPATVEIFDQIPVSGHEDIKVRTLSDATTPTETDMGGKQGLMMWRKTLKAGETWTIRHQYRITYPSDMQLISR